MNLPPAPGPAASGLRSRATKEQATREDDASVGPGACASGASASKQSPGARASAASASKQSLWVRASEASAELLARPLASYYLLVSSASLMLVIGLTMVFSATSVEQFGATGNAFSSIERQAIYAAVGLLAFWIFQRLPVRTYRALAKPGLILAFVLLGALDILALLAQAKVLQDPTFGPIRADELWLYLGPLQLQPSELAKIALAVWVADVLVRKGRRAGLWRELSRPLFVVAGILFIAVGYNDLGTMLCLGILFLGMLWAAGVRLRIFAGMAIVAALGVLALIFLPGNEYRLGRLNAFSDPTVNAQGDAYQFWQGLYAIGNGGWFGVGLGEARTKWGWLPNAHNDFIFAVIAEELGVVGCFVVLVLFGVLAYSGMRIARRVSNPFRRYVAAGVTALIAGQASINIAGVLGLVPITGLPLPLISDGGSALVVTLAMIGMLASFARAEPAAAYALHARPPGRLARLLWAPLPPMPRYVGDVPRDADAQRDSDLGERTDAGPGRSSND
jgi:cell division protein FtsW